MFVDPSENWNFSSVLISSSSIHSFLCPSTSTHTPLKTTKKKRPNRKKNRKGKMEKLFSFSPSLHLHRNACSCVIVPGHWDLSFPFKNPSRKMKSSKEKFFNNKKEKSFGFFSLKKHTQSTYTVLRTLLDMRLFKHTNFYSGYFSLPNPERRGKKIYSKREKRKVETYKNT